MLKNLYLVVGRSGSGKSTIVDKLHDTYGYTVLKSYTTRPKRHKNDTDHCYVTLSDYYQDQADGKIMAYTSYDGNVYWSTREQIVHSDLYVIDRDGIQALRSQYTGNRAMIVIYIDVDPEECIIRMKKRGDSTERINTRIIADGEKIVGLDELADFIVSGESETAWKTVQNIIEKCEKVGLYMK